MDMMIYIHDKWKTVLSLLLFRGDNRTSPAFLPNKAGGSAVGFLTEIQQASHTSQKARNLCVIEIACRRPLTIMIYHWLNQRNGELERGCVGEGRSPAGVQHDHYIMISESPRVAQLKCVNNYSE